MIENLKWICLSAVAVGLSGLFSAYAILSLTGLNLIAPMGIVGFIGAGGFTAYGRLIEGSDHSKTLSEGGLR